MKKLCAVLCFWLVPFLCFSGDYAVLTRPAIQPIEKSCQYELTDTLRVELSHSIMEVPKGFHSDLASVPFPVTCLFARSAPITVYPSVFHDYLYRERVGVSRKQADDWYYELLIAEGVGYYKALVYYTGVRLFGWWAYNE